MKDRIHMRAIALSLLPAVLSAGLCGCSSLKEEAGLLKSESGEIREFFGYHGSTMPSEPVYSVTAEREAAPILTRLTHTELLRSLYNSGNTIVSGGDLDLKTDTSSLALTESEKYGYVFVPRPADDRNDRQAEVLLAALAEQKITVSTEERRNPAPEGEVFAVRFAGLSDRDGFYVNPAIPVTLYVSAPKPAKTAQSGDNLVYITFDDGPTAENTVRLLDILDEYGVKAAFFTMGGAVRDNPDGVRAIEGRGHALGCHTMTHVYEDIYASADALKAEVAAWEDVVRSVGVRLPEEGKLFRFPGGSVGSWLTDEQSAEYTAMLEELGYFVFDWNVVINDAVLFTAPEGESAYDFIRESFAQTFDACLAENAGKSGAPVMILMHETVPQTIDLMPWMLEYLIDRGCVFGDLAQFGHSWTFADRRG